MEVNKCQCHPLHHRFLGALISPIGCQLWQDSPEYSGKQIERGDFLIFSSKRSFLFRKRIIEVSTNHLLLQMESNSFMLSFILKETKGRLDIKYYSRGVHYNKLWPHSHPDQDDMCSPGEIGSDELTLLVNLCGHKALFRDWDDDFRYQTVVWIIIS